MLSLFYASLLLAAGSNASPCKMQSGNWTSSSTTGVKGAAVNINQKLGTQANAGLNLPLAYSQESSSPSSTTASNASPSVSAPDSSGSSSASGGSGTSDTSTSLTPASGSCPQGFLNAVFNTNAGQSSGFPSATWNSLQNYGIDNWSTFTLTTSKDYSRVY